VAGHPCDPSLEPQPPPRCSGCGVSRHAVLVRQVLSFEFEIAGSEFVQHSPKESAMPEI
jgi:hypothetical protein